VSPRLAESWKDSLRLCTDDAFCSCQSKSDFKTALGSPVRSPARSERRPTYVRQNVFELVIESFHHSISLVAGLFLLNNVSMTGSLPSEIGRLSNLSESTQV
jgi:hypothetical protein